MTTNKLELIISAQNHATKVMKQIAGDVSAMSKNAVPKVKAVSNSLDKMNVEARQSIGVFSKLTTLVSAGAMGYAIKRIGEASITAGSNLQEVGSKFETVFKDQLPAANRWAVELQADYAMSRRESKEYLSSIQDLLVPMGMASDAAGKMSADVVKLAADLGSFNNKTTAQVMDDYQSALVGNYETMKKYGVVLNATTVQEKAMAMGLAKTKDALTASDKAMAAHQLIIEGSTAAMGDMGRTAEQYANTSKQLSADIENLSSTIGNSLLPSATKIKASISEWIQANEQLIGQKVTEYVQGVAAAISDSITWFKKHQAVIKSTASALGTAVVTYGKFWAISKTIAGGYGLIAFFNKAAKAVIAMKAGTLALNTAMKANLLALAAYGGYKLGNAISSIATGTWHIDAEIEATKKLNAQLEKNYQAALARTRDKQQQRENDLQSTLEMETRINAEIARQQEARAETARQAAEAAVANAKKILEGERETLSRRLSEYETFYNTLQAKIKAASDAETRHIKELMALYKQKNDIQAGTETLIRGLQEINMTPLERYKSQQEALSQQISAAMDLTGQDQIKALEAYKQAVAGFAREFAGGVKEAVGITGNQVINQSVADIAAAAEIQKATLDDLAMEKQRQVDADQAWLEELRDSAMDTAEYMDLLRDAIAEVNDQIESMDRDIDINGHDYVTAVVDHIQQELAALRDKTITITTVHRDVFTGSGSSSGPLGSYAAGTMYVPQTGMYQLHEGEIVAKRQVADAIRQDSALAALVAGKSRSGAGQAVFSGDINIHVPANSAPQSPGDWRNITRNYIMPELTALGR